MVSNHRLQIFFSGRQFALTWGQPNPSDPPGCASVLFERVCSKQITVGAFDFHQVWIPPRTLFPVRGSTAINLRPLLEYAILRARGLFGELPDATAEAITLAALLPHIRVIGANRIIPDAVLTTTEKEKTVADLEELLRSSPAAEIGRRDLMKYLRSAYGPGEHQYKLGSVYREMTDEIVRNGRRELSSSNKPDLPETIRLFSGLIQKYKRRDRHAEELDALDALSVESRTSLVQLYSSLWSDIIPGLAQVMGAAKLSTNPAPFLNFHRLWHLEPRWQHDWERDPNHLIQGHCLALHPAGSILMRSPSAQRLLEPLIANGWTWKDDEHPEVRRFFQALANAFHVYSTARSEYGDSRKFQGGAQKAKRLPLHTEPAASDDAEWD